MNSTDPLIPAPPDQEHWSDLHQPERGCLDNLLERAKNRIQHASFPEIAGAAMTGFAIGWLVFSRRRSGGFREILMGSLGPAAAKSVHDVWDQLRDSDTIHALGDRAAKLKARW